MTIIATVMTIRMVMVTLTKIWIIPVFMKNVQRQNTRTAIGQNGPLPLVLEGNNVGCNGMGGGDNAQLSFSLIGHRPVGSGKTALMLALCQRLRDTYSIAAVTNDIFTKEDTEFLVRNKALPEDRIAAIETGGCPHAVSLAPVSND